MVLIIDPDFLSQGALTSVTDAVFGTPTGRVVTITSIGTGLPVLAAGDFFEVRDHSDAENNGLWEETGGTPTTGSITATKVTGVDPVANAVGQSVRVFGNTTLEKSIHVDIGARDVYVLEKGNVTADGVTHQALYSFLKEEWKADADLIAFPYPITAITTEQFEWTKGWNPVDVVSPSIRTRKLIRTGGWSEIDAASVLLKQYSGIVTLGSFEDPAADVAYYTTGSDPTDTAAAADFDFPGPVDEAILVYSENLNAATNTVTFADANPDTMARTSGSWITDGYRVGSRVTVRNAAIVGNDGSYEITALSALTLTVTAIGGADAGLTASADTQAIFSLDYRAALSIFLRIRDADPNGKTYGQADLAGIGVTAVDNKVFRFPVSNQTDLKITETDANIDANSPYTEIQVRFLDAAYNREVDTVTKRSFGIVVDVGTYSMPNGVSALSTLFTSAALSGITLSDYAGGSLIVHEGADQGTHTIVGTPVNNAGVLEVTVSAALTAVASSLSFTLQRASPVVATGEEIYEKVQRELRLAADVDNTLAIVTGRTADALLTFTGDSLSAGADLPVNPNGGGSGVIIEGFDSNDTNRLSFFDNIGVSRTFPFVSAGTINFNDNLQNDTGPAEYWMFFQYTERFTNTGFAISAPTGSNATLNSSVTDLVTELADGDYIALFGYADTTLNGIWQLTGAPAGVGPWTAPVVKIDGAAIAAEVAGASVSLDKHPIDSPDALIVQNNAAANVAGNVPGPSAGFDFDYDGNIQGGRTAATDAAVALRAIGLDTAQFVETVGTVTRATGLVFTLVAALERNFSNP